MLSLDHITMAYGERTLFRDLSIVLGPMDRIGLVGVNGSGKSTMLKIIAGLITPESGTIGKARYVTCGYLPQDSVTPEGKTLYDEAATAFEDILDIRKKLEEAQQGLAALSPGCPEYGDLLNVTGELQHKLEDLDSYRMKSKIETVLMGLGFSTGDFARSTSEFSGGWQMRIALAKLLLREPSVLLLDEPTNHLDLDSLRWLEEYLRTYNGSVVLVSHDRAFLDSLTSKTVALTRGNVELYAGNYSFYEKEEQKRKELTLQAYRNQQQRIKQTQVFIDRFRYKATKARQVQSRIKQLEKLDLIAPDGEEEVIRFRFPPPKLSGSIVIVLESVRKTYGGMVIFENLSLAIERGDRIAVVGANGAGKSTLMRILAGTEPLDEGKRIPGHHVSLSYFAQHQAEELDMDKEAIEILDDVAVGEIRKKLRTILGSFLFHGDDVFKKVSVLSGGERSRLALAKMLLQPSNLLIMDEPTNHLDMHSKTILQDALQNFEGTYLIVSHDRAFLDPIVNKVLEVGKGSVRTYPGNVSEYLERKDIERRAAESGTASTDSIPRRIRDVPPTQKEKKRIEAERRQEQSRRLRPLRERLAIIEEEITHLERRKVEIETLMSGAEFYRNGAAAKTVSNEYRQLRRQITVSYQAWEEVSRIITDIEGADQG